MGFQDDAERLRQKSQTRAVVAGAVLVSGCTLDLPTRAVAVRLKPGFHLAFPAARASEGARQHQQRRLHIEAVPIGQLAGRDHDAVLAAIAAEPQPYFTSCWAIASRPAGVMCHFPST
jgi:hypothetical protein